MEVNDNSNLLHKIKKKKRNVKVTEASKIDSDVFLWFDSFQFDVVFFFFLQFWLVFEYSTSDLKQKKELFTVTRYSIFIEKQVN